MDFGQILVTVIVVLVVLYVVGRLRGTTTPTSAERPARNRRADSR
jgi:hypothetical protein